jgi:hypothetical protein
MFGSFASSRLALMLRRLRGRFGISAPRVAVRTHLPWYWRALSVICCPGRRWRWPAGSTTRGGSLRASTGVPASRRLAGCASASRSSRQSWRRAQDRQCQRKPVAHRKHVAGAAWPSRSACWRRRTRDSSRIWRPSKAWRVAGGESGSGDQPLADTSRRRRPISLPPLLAQTGDKKDKEFNGMIQLVAIVQRGKETAMIQFPPPTIRRQMPVSGQLPLLSADGRHIQSLAMPADPARRGPLDSGWRGQGQSECAL